MQFNCRFRESFACYEQTLLSELKSQLRLDAVYGDTNVSKDLSDQPNDTRLSQMLAHTKLKADLTMARARFRTEKISY